MRRLARVPFQGQAGDFRLMSRRVVDALRAMPERRRFLRGMVAWVGYDQVPIEYRRAARRSGRGASYPGCSCGSRSRRCRPSRMCHWRSRAGSGCSSPAVSARRGARHLRAHVGRRGQRVTRGVGLVRGPVSRRRAARQRGHPRALLGSRPRAGARPSAVPDRSRCRALRKPRTDGARARSERFTGASGRRSSSRVTFTRQTCRTMNLKRLPSSWAPRTAAGRELPYRR